MQKMIPALTDRQRYWLEHIQACEASGKSIAEYAAAQEFGAQAMYAGKSALVKKGVLPATQLTRFQRVQVMEATFSSQWRIGLPNGVSVAFVGEVDSQALTTILHSAASLE
ncbi:MAG: hypothetical protein V3R56_01685 [Xanthomonadales bacterium]